MNDANHQLLDRFSVVHAAVGAVAELSGIPAPLAIGLQILFELIENDVKRSVRHIWPDDRPDGIENQIGDVASFVAGFYAARAAKGDPAGGVALTALAGAAGAIWMHSLLPPNRKRALPAGRR